MKNNKLFLLLSGFLLLSIFTLTAQTSRKDMVGITPVVSDEMDLPTAIKSVLENKTRQMVTSHGMADLSERFVLVPNITVLTKDVTATAPPMFALTVDISFFVLDAVEGVIVNEITYPIKAVDRLEDKAFIQAINKINPRSDEVRLFIDGSKRRILEYYKSHLSAIIKQAQSMAAQGNYEDALSRLSSIPEIIEGYDAVGNAISSIYGQYLNREAEMLINEAKSKIAVRNYSEAMEALAKVDPESDRFKAATDLVAKVKASIDAKEQAAIATQVKRYEERREDALRIHDDKVALTKQYIDAARDVGVAQAQNQKPTVIQVVNNWFKAKFR
ncbi:MAG: hypothetical protein LBT83_03820 [Tannerella sp.]|nr:hypothetical protein [Tannerella sp.]